MSIHFPEQRVIAGVQDFQTERADDEIIESEKYLEPASSGGRLIALGDPRHK